MSPGDLPFLIECISYLLATVITILHRRKARIIVPVSVGTQRRYSFFTLVHYDVMVASDWDRRHRRWRPTTTRRQIIFPSPKICYYQATISISTRRG
mmetsp:Transcript_25639/g.38712  ORF Transcript_25639/g.38712 Transcript_25639/m.38712 type:complete len:97 (+) Transcript_25639:77-367(+)